MIYYLKGILTELTQGFACIDCGGVGYGAAISSKTYNKLIADGAFTPSGDNAGIEVKLYTAVRLRDESVFDVFGFYSRAESAMFTLLQSVSGVGPKASLAILSVLEPEEICSAVTSDNIRLISTAQGVGSKAAQKICIDLKNKVDAFMLEHSLFANENVSRETASAQQGALGDEAKLALDALVNLGYTKAQATKALEKASGSTAEDLIRTALAQLF